MADESPADADALADTSKLTQSLSPKTLRISILLFCTSTFFFWASLYLYVPVLPVHARSLGASLSMVGAVISSYALAQLVLRIPLGVWTDALGRRKPFVAAGIFMAILGGLGLGLANSPWVLFAARAATGVAAAAWVVFTVFFVAYYPARQTARAIGIITFVNGVSMVVATVSGGVVAQTWGVKATFFGAALLGVLSVLALLPAKEAMSQKTLHFSWNAFKMVATNPLLLTTSFLSIILQFVNMSTVFGFIPVYGARIGASSADLGIITTIALASGAAASLGSVFVAERWGYPKTIVLGALLLGLGLAVIPIIQQVYVLKLVQVVSGIGRGLLITILMALSIRTVPPQQRATAMGVYQALYAIGMLTGPLVSGVLADHLGLSSVFYFSAFLSLAIAALAFLPLLNKAPTPTTP